jgi:hypothetical protein
VQSGIDPTVVTGSAAIVVGIILVFAAHELIDAVVSKQASSLDGVAAERGYRRAPVDGERVRQSLRSFHQKRPRVWLLSWVLFAAAGLFLIETTFLLTFLSYGTTITPVGWALGYLLLSGFASVVVIGLFHSWKQI